MNGQRYRETPSTSKRLRRLNRATVERYMAMKGPNGYSGTAYSSRTAAPATGPRKAANPWFSGP